jgi:F-type H+-transporting ATPase subunit gamma
MTYQLADISARIEGIHQLETVVNAMKGIAAARVRNALMQVEAVDSYAAIIADAMSSALPPDTSREMRRVQENAFGKSGLLVFCAEQGFTGPFSEGVLDSIGDAPESRELLLVGTRGLSIARARGLAPIWDAAMPSHSTSIPKLADGIANAVFGFIETGEMERLDVIYPALEAGRVQVIRKSLFPLDFAEFSRKTAEMRLTQLPPEELLTSLGAEYLHARICKSALHAFAAENQARMVAMSSADSHIAAELDLFEATLRRVRQEAITAEIIELGTGTASGQTYKINKQKPNPR